MFPVFHSPFNARLAWLPAKMAPAPERQQEQQQPNLLAITAVRVLSVEVRNALASLPESSCNAASGPAKPVTRSRPKSSPRPFLTLLETHLNTVEERLESGTQTVAKILKLLVILEKLSTASGPELKPSTSKPFAN